MRESGEVYRSLKHVSEIFLYETSLSLRLDGGGLVGRRALFLVHRGQGPVGFCLDYRLGPHDVRFRDAFSLRISRREAEYHLSCAECVFRSARRAQGWSIRRGG